MDIIRDVKHSACKVYDKDISLLEFNSLVDNNIVELPDK